MITERTFTRQGSGKQFCCVLSMLKHSLFGLSVGLRAGLAASIAGSSIISKMLLANIDPFGATPFIDPDLDSL